MDHKLFELWFEERLLKAIKPDTVIVMDNASFHRKKVLVKLAQKSSCSVIFLPTYSPALNPIEKFWTHLKRKLKKNPPKITQT